MPAPPAQDSDRLYLGNLPKETTRADVEEFFGKEEMERSVTEIKLLGVFGFVQCKTVLAAREIIPKFHGKLIGENRVSVQMARGIARTGDSFPPGGRPGGKRSSFRMIVTGLPDTSWQDLKDFARKGDPDVVFSEIDRSGSGIIEYGTEAALHTAVKILDGTPYKGKGEDKTRIVACRIDAGGGGPPPRGRSRSPVRGRYGAPPGRYPPSPPSIPRRGYTPPPPRGAGGGYRGYSPREYYESRSPRRQYRGNGYDRERLSPPPRHMYPHPDDYRRREDPYPPKRGYEDERYGPMPGHRGDYDRRPPSPRERIRERTPLAPRGEPDYRSGRRAYEEERPHRGYH
ncbi:hypothetical protein BJ508DRAFT_324383 [Ascobolus immersus RN42]|uniref:RRM domain-containing protein n=1 Tax=Ascobolus immersus RN42 TaxID=1160509 RepID=A0A3N4IC54_ASCIM|nr:hypothetical protein BJ508DRAFT_324383 [Ascobolus immersus RN42]